MKMVKHCHEESQSNMEKAQGALLGEFFLEIVFVVFYSSWIFNFPFCTWISMKTQISTWNNNSVICIEIQYFWSEIYN